MAQPRCTTPPLLLVLEGTDLLPEAIMALVKAGAGVNAKDNNGHTALILALGKKQQTTATLS